MRFKKQRYLRDPSKPDEAKEFIHDGNTSSIEGVESEERDVAITSGYQCKPDLSCWSFLPSQIKEKADKLKK